MIGGTNLATAARAVLCEADAPEKAARTLCLVAAWRAGNLPAGEQHIAMPERPARPARPELLPPRDMPRRRTGGTAGRIALLHAVTHIELNAIDLAWDLIGRFGAEDWPGEFYADWLGVAEDEARHFNLLQGRLNDLGACYGDLPAHDGLWQAAMATAHDPLARLAVVPMVLEARGLDVTPNMIARLRRAGDNSSADILEVIYQEEISHVAAGTRWFNHLCRARGLPEVETWRALVGKYYGGILKAPFNEAARSASGMAPELYASLG
ncbi:MAG: ferritin-like domain-containing protein [Rhodospirillaceae bacterium]|nr:ferritin-like domain-containing protein [Rhodospirillaceae bacterium]MBT5040388.1 ferritin-like domain-containing protein [Rhodospirillaceae bacterium]MBT5779909.1 ferritin-like domain-containing protein [Rhodospirillaceae bacterium]MBT7294249.1 ferritin-like domain-containing protein [Rhodospirillaceae bacterium]